MSIEIIKALYDPKEQLPQNPSFYKNAIEDIEFFGISSQVYYLLKEKGELGKTPLFFQERLKLKYLEALYQNLYIKNQTELILNALEENKIMVIPLKGVGFAEKYFGHIGARATTDIDILVKKKDIENVIRTVKLLGFTQGEDQISNHFHLNFSKLLPGSPVPLTVEIHWDILKEGSADFKIAEFWTNSKPIESKEYVRELSEYHTLYLIFMHGWSHNLISLKYFIDILQLLHILREQTNYSSLIEDVKKHKTFNRLVRTLSIVYNYFPHLEEVKEFPFKRTIPFWDYSLYRNINKKSIKTYLDYLNWQFFSYDTLKHSMFELREWLYPCKSGVTVQLGKEVKRFPYLYLLKKRLLTFIHNLS